MNMKKIRMKISCNKLQGETVIILLQRSYRLPTKPEMIRSEKVKIIQNNSSDKLGLVEPGSRFPMNGFWLKRFHLLYFEVIFHKMLYLFKAFVYFGSVFSA